MAIINVKNLNKEFMFKPILKNINFTVEKGDKIGLVGNNGSGKTTLFNILTKKIEPDEGEIYIQKNLKLSYLTQHINIDSNRTIKDELMSAFKEIFDLEDEIKKLQDKIAIAKDKELEILLNEYSTLTEIFNEKKGFEAESRVLGTLNGLGFTEKDFDRKVNSLSGGQKSRVQLGKLLLKNNEFLLLDEPTNHLDIDTMNWLEKYLKDFTGSLIVISHDRFFLDNICNRIFIIQNCELSAYNGNYTEFMKKRKEDLKIRQHQYENQQAEIKIQKQIIEKFLSVGREKSIRQGLSRQKQLDKIELIEPIRSENVAKIKFKTKIKAGNDIFIAEDLKKSFGEKKIFENLSFKVFNRDRIGIVGKNGIGKSTLFNILSGKLSYDDGILNVGSNVNIGYFDQEMKNLNLTKTIIEEIWDEYPKLTHFQIRSYLAKMNFIGEDVLKEIKNLSGGEKSRVAILKLMLSNSNVLLLDEPTNHLDIDSKEVLENALEDYEGTVIAISHDRYFLNNFADKIWEMKSDGITEYLGNYDYYFNKKNYLENFSANEEKKLITKTARKNLQKEERQKISERKKKREEIEKLENHIQELEEKMREIDLKLSDPKISSDYTKVLEIGKLREITEAELKNLYDEWIKIM